MKQTVSFSLVTFMAGRQCLLQQHEFLIRSFACSSLQLDCD
jgi:hypothetical protein